MVSYECSFGGVKFRICDPEILRAAEDWLDAQALPPLRVADDIGANFTGADMEEDGHAPWLGLYEYLYPPTAARWSVFRGLMHKDDLDTILPIAFGASGPVAQTFILEDGSDPKRTAPTISTPLFMLTPRPLVGVKGATDLYLVTLVDERYFWKYKPKDFWTDINTEFTSWSVAIDAIATQLGITLTYGGADSVYGKPELDSAIFQHYENTAILLDLCLANIGKILTRKKDGTYEAVTHAAADGYAKTAVEAIQNDYRAGGKKFADKSTADAKERVVDLADTYIITFPKWSDSEGYEAPLGIPGSRDHEGNWAYGAVYAKTVHLSDLGAPYTAFTQKNNTATIAIADSAKAILDKPSGTITAASQAQVDALATQLAKDYVDAALGYRYNQAFTGIVWIDHRAAHSVVYTFAEDPNTHIFSEYVPRREFQHGFGAKGYGEVMLQVQDFYSYDSPARMGYYPAIVQRWVPFSTSGGLNTFGKWENANSTVVRVTDLNRLAAMKPGEYVKAKFVEDHSSALGNFKLYHRVGLDGQHINGSWSLENTTFFNGLGAGSTYPNTGVAGNPGVRQINFLHPLYTHDPYTPSGPGLSNVNVAPSTASTQGILMGAADTLTMNPPYNGQDPWRKGSVFQWARSGYTGFTSLMSNGFYLSNKTPPGTNGFGYVPPDTDFQAWFQGGSVIQTGGDGTYDLNIQTGPQYGFTISTSGLNNLGATVTWGGSTGRQIPYKNYNVRTEHMTISVPGGITDVVVSGLFKATMGQQLIQLDNTGVHIGGSVGSTQGGSIHVGQGGVQIGGAPSTDINGAINLGTPATFAALSQTNHNNRNYVTGIEGGPAGGIWTSTSDLRNTQWNANQRAGWYFKNGLYMGGLEWLESLRVPPGYVGGSRMHTPVEIFVFSNPVYPPPSSGPLGGNSYWVSMSAGGH